MTSLATRRPVDGTVPGKAPDVRDICGRPGQWRCAVFGDFCARVHPNRLTCRLTVALASNVSYSELYMGPFCLTQSNPTHQLTEPTQPTTSGEIWTRPDPWVSPTHGQLCWHLDSPHDATRIRPQLGRGMQILIDAAPAASDRRCCCRSTGQTDRQTDGRTDRYLDPASHAIRATSVT